MKNIYRKGVGLLSVLLASTVLLSACNAITNNQGVSIGNTRETSNIVQIAEPLSEEQQAQKMQRSVAEAATRTDVSPTTNKEPLTTPEIAAIAQPTVVAITTTGLQSTVWGMMEFQAAGSGVIISEDGYIVTNNHVVSGAEQIDVVLATGNSYTAELIGTAPANDLAVLKIEASELPYASFGNSDDLIVGELAIAVGNPLGDFQGTVTSGIVSSLGRTLVLEENGNLVELQNLIQTDAAINSGNSGGGLFNSYGELIGINVAKASSSSSAASVEGLGFAIPANTAAPIINSIVNTGHVEGAPSLNILGSNVSQSMASAYEGVLVPGVWIRDIQADSPVLDAGMEVGDIIVEFAGVEVSSIAELNLVKNRYKAGDTVDVRYFRAGEYYDTQVTLDELGS